MHCSPLIMRSNVFYYFFVGHLPVTELFVSFDTVIDLAFMAQRFLASMILKLPTGYWCDNDHGFIEKPAGESVPITAGAYGCFQRFLSFLLAKLCCHLFRQKHGLSCVFSTVDARANKALPILRIRFVET